MAPVYRTGAQERESGGPLQHHGCPARGAPGTIVGDV